MALTLIQAQSISDLEKLLYDFLPGSHFEIIAGSLGLSQYWQPGASKGPNISNLLKNTYDFQNGKFCSLIVKIVEDSIAYGNRKGNPLQRDAVEYLNQLILKLNFKIPDLWNTEFLATLCSEKKEDLVKKQDDKTHYDSFMKLLAMDPENRGFAFEKFLYNYFKDHNMNPRGSFRITGEQIDGSFEFKDEVYLLEAKWQNQQTSENDLLVFSGKIGSKAEWTRGLFLSYAGFTEQGLIAFSKGKRTNMIGMTGEELSRVLIGKMKLEDIFTKKIRNAAETGDFLSLIF
jgi:hypothetical protein